MDDFEDKHNIEELVDYEDRELTLEVISMIATSPKVRSVYEGLYPKSLYSEIMLALVHESYGEKEARSMWHGILHHLSTMNRKMGRDVGVAVAALDYLTNISHELQDPCIMEETKSDFVADAATRDELTGLYMRQVFEVILEREVEEAKRNSSPLSLLMLDIDEFKSVNDTYGHPVGDVVLREIGGLILRTVRAMDLAARYGGDEMVIVMPRVTRETTVQVAERL
ncbi:diguanylate cyclase, partial [Myxococcota bacterium]|nr:diguanylate cyclase [Myxococcota bacterium]